MSHTTDPLYLERSDARRFEATVERTVDDRIVLDRTLFYPDGGGQPADTGAVRPVDDGNGTAGVREAAAPADEATGWRVTDVQKGDTIYHHLEADDDLAVPDEGTTVVGTLDWDRRRAHMRYHTAQHLLSAVLLDEYDARTTGNQLYADRARLDCEHDRFDGADLERIESELNALIDADLPVRWYELDRDVAERRLDAERTRLDLLPDSVTEVRIVEIGDEADPFDRVACAGTHVSHTGAIGRLEVTGRETAGSGRERVRVRLGAA